MPRKLVECVANFSEGRRWEVVDAIAGRIAREPGVAVLHRTMDADHNRAVITFAGPPQSVANAAVHAVGEAAKWIDLNRHQGVHPRIGAADVVPFVPLEGMSLEECVPLARAAGERIWAEYGVPVYFYEAAAVRADRRRLEQVRKGQFEGLRQSSGIDPERRPDIGGPGLHPTAGAVAVGARDVLVACNVDLDSTDLELARAIARSVRSSSGGFPHVKALGLALPSRGGRVQVSMNLTNYRETPLHTVFAAIERQAAAHGVAVAGTEIVGLLPRAALEWAGCEALRIRGFETSRVLEAAVADALPPLAAVRTEIERICAEHPEAVQLLSRLRALIETH